jgi:hypothetical protein
LTRTQGKGKIEFKDGNGNVAIEIRVEIDWYQETRYGSRELIGLYFSGGACTSGWGGT